MTQARLVIVDDHSVVRAGVRSLFEGSPEFEVVGEADRLSAAVELCSHAKPTLVLLDVRLPDGDRGNGAARIKKVSPETRVLVLSAFGDRDTVREALDHGADGFLVKDADGAAIREAVAAVLRGETVVPAGFRPGVPAPREPLPVEALSTREREVLQLLSEGYQNKEIAAALELAEKSVRNVVTRLFRKLEVSNRTEAALRAREIAKMRLLG